MADNSQEKEELVISGLLKHGKEVWPEIAPYIKTGYFKHKITRTVFNVVRNLLEDYKEADYLVVAEKINTLNITFEGIDMTTYLETLSDSSISMDGTVSSAKSVIHAGVRRKMYLDLKKVQNYLNEDKTIDEPIDRVVAKCDKMYADTMSLLGSYSLEPVSLTKTLKAYLEHKEYDERRFLYTPWQNFNKIFGGLRLKDSYCFAGRPGENKSTALQYLAFKVASDKRNYFKGRPLKVLAIDTEMDEDEQRERLAASISGVDAFSIESGRWKKNKEMFNKVAESLKDIDKFNYDHIYCPKQSVDELISMIRRWIYKNLDSDEAGVIVYDYLKLSGEDLNKSVESRLSIAYKLDKLKDEIKEKTNCVFLFGAQRNRYGADDDSSIAESDHIQKLATFVTLLKKKNLDELAKEPEEMFGTHKLITVKARKLGEGAREYGDFVKIDGEYHRNWINLKFDNFKMEEMGTGKDVRDFIELEEAEGHSQIGDTHMRNKESNEKKKKDLSKYKKQPESEEGELPI